MDGKTYQGSYYHLTAANFAITKAIEKDPSRFAASPNVKQGEENNEIVLELIGLKTKKSMFKQGEPASFMQTLMDEIGVDAWKSENFAQNQSNILASIDNQRLSVSGVDEDEEAMGLVRFQHAYNLSAKIISVMDQVLDKLINDMGV